MERRWRGDGEEMERRWRGDGEEMERRWRGDGEEMERRWRGDIELIKYYENKALLIQSCINKTRKDYKVCEHKVYLA